MDADDATSRELQTQINDAVTMALLKQTIALHEKRLTALEAFRWWLLTAVAIGALSSSGTLALILIQHGGKP